MPLMRNRPLSPAAVMNVNENGYFESDRVSARKNLKTGEVDANDVTHIDAARNQIIGSIAGLIPFIEKNYVYRSLMGSNQQRQAVPLIQPGSSDCRYWHGSRRRPQYRPGNCC